MSPQQNPGSQVVKTFSEKSNCRRTAKKSFGPNSAEGVDFTIGGKKGAWFYEALAPAVAPEPAPIAKPVAAAPAAKKERAPRSRSGESKADRVIAMLKEPAGASVDEIAAAMGWQKHTCRGLVSGTVKKKLGLNVIAEKSAGRGTVYRIPE